MVMNPLLVRMRAVGFSCFISFANSWYISESVSFRVVFKGIQLL